MDAHEIDAEEDTGNPLADSPGNTEPEESLVPALGPHFDAIKHNKTDD